MTWHADPESLAAYSAGRLHDARAASVEAHVMSCSSCRNALADLTDQDRLASAWAAVAERVDSPSATVFERLLRRMGVSERTARLIVVTPSVRLPWVLAVSLVLALTVVATHSDVGDGAVFAFLVAAPLLPLVGIALSFGRSDPAREITLVAPVRKIDLLLARAFTVLVVTTAISSMATVALDREDWSAVAWLLPALGLTSGALALSMWMSTSWAAGIISGVWVTGAITSVHGASLHHHVVEQFVAFRPEGQFGCLLIAAFGVVVVLFRRDALDVGRIA